MQHLFHQTAFESFLSKLFVGFAKLYSSLRDPVIEFAGNPLLLAQEPCLL